MANFGFAFKSADRNAIKFEAMVHRVGQGDARKAFSRALNHEGKKAHTLVKRTLRKETSIKTPYVNRAVKFIFAKPNDLRAISEGTGKAMPLRYFGVRQTRAGLSAIVWGRRQRFPGAFQPDSVAGGKGAFVRTGLFNKKSGRRNAFRTMFGPSIPKEMLEPATAETFTRGSDGLAERAMHELNRILNS